MQDRTDWKMLAAKLFCLAFGGLAAYMAIKRFLPTVLLFASVLLVSYGVSGLARRLWRATKIPAPLWAFLTVTLILIGVGAVLFFALRSLIVQMSAVAREFGVGGALELHRLIRAFREIPVFGELIYDSGEYATAELAPALSNILSNAAGALSALASRVLAATPSALMSGAVAVMSLYYLSADFDGICAFVLRLLPQNVKTSLSPLKRSALSVGIKFVRAHAILFALTFAQLLVGLLIIRPQYALVGALGIAAVDMLPVLGSGTVLLPWSLICFVCHDTLSGVALLILYATVSIVRRIAEPKIVGQSIGLHPFGALLCMYLGYRVLGMLGMFVAPAVVSMLAAYVQNRDKGVQ